MSCRPLMAPVRKKGERQEYNPGGNAVDTVPGNGTGHGDVPEMLRIGGNGRCVFA